MNKSISGHEFKGTSEGFFRLIINESYILFVDTPKFFTRHEFATIPFKQPFQLQQVEGLKLIYFL